jgi:hypothetical protein
MIFKRNIVTVIAVLLLAVSGWAQSADEDHKTSIQGIEIGMNAQQVLDRLGRMPDGRKDEKGEIIVYWKLEGGNALQVTLRKEAVSHLALQYRPPRATSELWLQPLYSAPSGELTARDPRLRVDYKPTETSDKLCTAWRRREKTADGYSVEIQFLSASRKDRGDRFEEYVEYKYVTVPKDELKKFDKAAEARLKQQ